MPTFTEKGLGFRVAMAMAAWLAVGSSAGLHAADFAWNDLAKPVLKNGVPDGWQEAGKLLSCAPAEDGVTLTVARESNLHGSLQQMIAVFPRDARIAFSAEVSATAPGLAYLQIKLYQGDKELRRLSSPMNGQQDGRLRVVADTAGADKISVHCRLLADAARVGQSATFRKLSLASEGPATAAKPVGGVPEVGGWKNERPGESALKPAADGNGFSVTFAAANPWRDGAVSRTVTGLPPDTDLRFTARVKAARGGIASLLVRLLKNGKEFDRYPSPGNAPGESLLYVNINTRDADAVEFSCRTDLRSGGNVGQTAAFSDLAYGPGTHVPPAPRFELVPGYEVCSIALNQCTAPDRSAFTAKASYREESGGAWLPALDLVYMPGEKSARGSIVNLREDTAYRVRVELDDAGRKETFEQPFRTKTPAVPVARNVVLGPADAGKSLVITESGTADGYLRYSAAPGFVLDGGDTDDHAVFVDGAKYVVLDGLTIRGGRVNGVFLNHAEQVQVVNCDIAGFGRIGQRRPDLDGKFHENDRPLNNDAGLRIVGGKGLLVERNYIHDPRGTSNAWFHSHPAGPNAVFLGEAAEVALRYNDFVGSDAKRWNDAVESTYNGAWFGGPYRDAEIKGNLFAFANDDGMELDGGQRNCRFFGNRTEGALCGVSTAPCLEGPSYLFNNLFANPGDELGYRNVGFKNGYSHAGRGRLFFLNNTVVGAWDAINAYSGGKDRTAGPETPKGFSRNNLFAVTGNLIPRGLYRHGNDFDHDLLFSTDSVVPPAAIQTEFNQERHAVLAEPSFADAARGDYRLAAGSPGTAAGATVPNFAPGEKPSMGALPPGGDPDLPLRPFPFRLDAATLFFDAARADGIVPATVTLTATRPGFRSPFRVLRNDASPFIVVTPTEGVVEHGKPVTLSVTVDPRHFTRARRNSGAFLVRLPDGSSRPVTVYADTTGDAALLARDRAEAVYGTVGQARENGAIPFTFDVPSKGSYYLFARWEKAPRRRNLRLELDGGAAFNGYAHWIGSPEARWGCLGTAEGRSHANRPLALEAGRRTITVVPEKPFDNAILEVALARQPETFALAPAADRRDDPALPAILLAGDSTLCKYGAHRAPQNGWGQQLAKFVRPGVRIANHAAGGRSTKSFRDEGRWDRLLAEVRPGDFVVIQFGHNDQKKDKPEVHAAADGDYLDNLKRFIAEVRAKQGRPVLATSIPRRVFAADGTLRKTLGGYPEAARRAGRETDVPVIDLNGILFTRFAEVGDASSVQWFTHTQPGAFPGFPQGSRDNTHLNVIGAEMVARTFAHAATRECPDLAPLLLPREE